MLQHWCYVTKTFSCSSSDVRANNKKKPEKLHIFLHLPLPQNIKILPHNFRNSSVLAALCHKQAAENCHIYMKTETLQFLLYCPAGLGCGGIKQKSLICLVLKAQIAHQKISRIRRSGILIHQLTKAVGKVFFGTNLEKFRTEAWHVLKQLICRTVAERLRNLPGSASPQTCNKGLSQSELLRVAAWAKGTADGDRTPATSRLSMLLAPETCTLPLPCLGKQLGSAGWETKTKTHCFQKRVMQSTRNTERLHLQRIKKCLTLRKANQQQLLHA